MRRWLLPEAIEDVLPAESWQVETLRRRLLDEWRRHGYEYVIPPLLEYVESLLTGSGRDLDLRTFKLVDQLSGRTMGIRADIAPQVARIDAHLLNRKGVTRLCYCGSVLHTLPAGLTATRQPLQIGAELYGHSGSEADAEMLRLLAQALRFSGVAATRIDIGHVGVFRALAAQAGLEAEQEQDLFGALQAKDQPSLRELVAGLAEPYRSALLLLPECYGGMEALERAAERLPNLSEITQALAELRAVAGAVKDLPVSFDLADLRGLHYHSGVVFAAYCVGHPGAIALGGRYDKVGKAFGRSRAATGFSLDLRELARLAPC
ncbi:MAG: ATP phosphoribosyltransferase regulatory subunit, partial [Proteobacteria bacterium]|nr:ATP phosphoribosyltransferase regulatory subunit [Pseudomonadota bacterium]